MIGALIVQAVIHVEHEMIGAAEPASTVEPPAIDSPLGVWVGLASAAVHVARANDGERVAQRARHDVNDDRAIGARPTKALNLLSGG